MDGRLPVETAYKPALLTVFESEPVPTSEPLTTVPALVPVDDLPEPPDRPVPPAETPPVLDPRAAFTSMFFGLIYMTTEVAELFKVHRKQVLDWVSNGVLPAINVGSEDSKCRMFRFRAADLIHFVKRHVVNLPTHLEDRKRDPLENLIARFDETLGRMVLHPSNERNSE